MEQKKGVSEAVYDDLKMLSAVQEACVLQFRAENGGVVLLETKIADVFEDEDGQFLIAENNLLVPLLRLISINGKPLEPFC